MWLARLNKNGNVVVIADPAPGDFDECATCPGYAVFNADPDDGYLGEIQRCDTCEKFPADYEAAQQAVRDGFVLNFVRGRGWLVIETPDVREVPK